MERPRDFYRCSFFALCPCDWKGVEQAREALAGKEGRGDGDEVGVCRGYAYENAEVYGFLILESWVDGLSVSGN